MVCEKKQSCIGGKAKRGSVLLRNAFVDYAVVLCGGYEEGLEKNESFLCENHFALLLSQYGTQKTVSDKAADDSQNPSGEENA